MAAVGRYIEAVRAEFIKYKRPRPLSVMEIVTDYFKAVFRFHHERGHKIDPVRHINSEASWDIFEIWVRRRHNGWELYIHSSYLRELRRDVNKRQNFCIKME